MQVMAQFQNRIVSVDSQGIVFASSIVVPYDYSNILMLTWTSMQPDGSDGTGMLMLSSSSQEPIQGITDYQTYIIHLVAAYETEKDRQEQEQELANKQYAYDTDRLAVEVIHAKRAENSQLTWIATLNENPQPTNKTHEYARLYQSGVLPEMRAAFAEIDNQHGVPLSENSSVPEPLAICPHCAVVMRRRTPFISTYLTCPKCLRNFDESKFMLYPDTPMTLEEKGEAFDLAVATVLDDYAKSRGWDSLAKMLAQSNSSIYASDAAAAQTASDTTWGYVTQNNLRDQVMAGTLTIEAAILMLPDLDGGSIVSPPNSITLENSRTGWTPPYPGTLNFTSTALLVPLGSIREDNIIIYPSGLLQGNKGQWTVKMGSTYDWSGMISMVFTPSA